MDDAGVSPATEQARSPQNHVVGSEITEFEVEGNPFASYVASEVLLSLQHPRTGSAAEPSFLIMTQVMELLFKLAHIETLHTRDLLDGDDVAGALWTLRRLSHVYSTLNGTWHVLSSLSPTEYGEFRDQLGGGSGVQSYMYRQLELLLGNKAPEMVKAHRGNRQVYRDLRRTLAEPSLYDATLRLLWRRGLPVPRSCVERDWSERHQELATVVNVWQTIYTEQDKHIDLYHLGEALVGLAYNAGLWRLTHLLTVERLLGSKSGTAGTDGVSWLRRVSEHRFFPELWTVRGKL